MVFLFGTGTLAASLEHEHTAKDSDSVAPFPTGGDAQRRPIFADGTTPRHTVHSTGQCRSNPVAGSTCNAAAHQYRHCDAPSMVFASTRTASRSPTPTREAAARFFDSAIRHDCRRPAKTVRQQDVWRALGLYPRPQLFNLVMVAREHGLANPFRGCPGVEPEPLLGYRGDARPEHSLPWNRSARMFTIPRHFHQPTNSRRAR